MNQTERINNLKFGFTLPELLVAIAAIALLSAGVGRIFTSVSSLIAVGTAVAEVDQVARTLEKQLRDDIEAFNSIPSGETFFAIRWREVGDLDRNGMLEPADGEVPIYLTADDRDADRLAITSGEILGVYAEGSKAMTRRVDEIMFLAFNGAKGYSSYQVTTENTAADALSQYARIYYGHGLAPRPDPNWPPEDHANPLLPVAPERQFIPDGDFGSSPLPVLPTISNANRFDDLREPVKGRNEFASGWSLLRQPMVLYGGEAAGFGSGSGGNIASPIGFDREIAPYIRDLEIEQRVPVFENVFKESELEDFLLINSDRPDYRRIRSGRVDLCAQDHIDVQRWIEGEDPNSAGSGRAFTSGRLTTLTGSDPINPQGFANNPLWRRTGVDNHDRAATQRAIAGMFTRILADPVAPVLNRAPIVLRQDHPQPEDALMDLHAILGTQCSNFEIAWSDGSTAANDIDFDLDGEVDIPWGEVIWFDMTVVSNLGGLPIRSFFQNWTLPAMSSRIQLQSNPNDPDIVEAEITQSAIQSDPLDDFFYQDPGYQSDSSLSVHVTSGLPGANGSIPFATSGPVYSTYLTGGAPDPLDESFLIMPFRHPDGTSWKKQMLLRVRVTLHDSRGSLPEGKNFEFIFSLDPGGS